MPAGDLCTLQDLVSYLGDPSIGATSLTALSFLISQVSAWAEGYCEQSFTGLNVYNWVTDGRGGNTLPVPYPPIVAVGQVLIDNVAIPPSDGLCYGWLADSSRITLRGERFRRDKMNVSITYTSGYPYVFTPGNPTPGLGDTIAGLPADLRWAVIETVALRFKRRASLGKNSESIQGMNTSYDNAIAPKDALSALNRYRKVTPWL